MARILIVTEAVRDFEAGDIIAVLPDGHRFGRYETAEEWVAAGRDRAAFPNPAFTVIDLPGEPADLNLAEPGYAIDHLGKKETIEKRAWWVDLDRLSKDQRAEVESAGAVVRWPKRRRRVIRRKHDDRELPPSMGLGHRTYRQTATRPVNRPPGNRAGRGGS